MFQKKYIALMVFAVLSGLVSSAASPGCSCDAHGKYPGGKPGASLASSLLK